MLLTRPEPGASGTAAALRREVNGVVILCAPLMEMHYLTPMVADRDYSAVIFTSRAAVAAAIRLREGGVTLPNNAYAVGDGTAGAATAAGFYTQSARGDAQALLAVIEATPQCGTLLHLRGQEVGTSIADRLNSAGIETVEAVIYRQVALPLTAKARRLLAGTSRVILPLFSPRSATLFRNAIARISAPLEIVSMSAAVADAAAAIPAQHRSIAAEPSEPAMVWSVATRLRQNPDLNAMASDH